MTKGSIITPHHSVKEAIQKIDDVGKKVVLVVDEHNKLLGIFTDGDMRRYILKNGDLSAPVSNAMNKAPVVFKDYESIKKHQLQSKMLVYPIIDDDNHLMDVLFWNDEEETDVIETTLQQVPVVVMAGGKGTRLYPYTKILPKPLIPIGDMTITERIIDQFRKYGCEAFYFVLNHKANMIKAYFNELEKDYQVYYAEEETFLGTGGGLSLLKDQLQTTFFVSNCDNIIDADYGHIYNFHKQHQNQITMVCALTTLTVPYGVVELNDTGAIKDMTEKPSFPFLTNTGLYILEPEVLAQLQAGIFMHMTDIIKTYLNAGKKVGVYPISEKAWLDMGQVETLEHMMQSLGVR